MESKWCVQAVLIMPCPTSIIAGPKGFTKCIFLALSLTDMCQNLQHCHRESLLCTKSAATLHGSHQIMRLIATSPRSYRILLWYDKEESKNGLKKKNNNEQVGFHVWSLERTLKGNVTCLENIFSARPVGKEISFGISSVFPCACRGPFFRLVCRHLPLLSYLLETFCDICQTHCGTGGVGRNQKHPWLYTIFAGRARAKSLTTEPAESSLVTLRGFHVLPQATWKKGSP